MAKKNLKGGSNGEEYNRISCCFLILPLPAFAASIGQTKTLGQRKFGVAFDYEYVFIRKTKFTKSNTEGFRTENGKLKNMDRETIKVSYGLLDNLDVFTRIGMVDYESVTIAYAATPTYAGKSKLKSPYTFTYGFGAKYSYPFAENWLIGVDGQYIYQKGKKTERTPLVTNVEWTSEGKMTIHDWQVGVFVGRKIDRLTPYAGVKYSDLRIKAKEFDTTAWVKAEGRYNIGPFIGVDCNITDHLRLNIEGRFVDETAISVGAACKF